MISGVIWVRRESFIVIILVVGRVAGIVVEVWEVVGFRVELVGFRGRWFSDGFVFSFI